MNVHITIDLVRSGAGDWMAIVPSGTDEAELAVEGETAAEALDELKSLLETVLGAQAGSLHLHIRNLSHG